MQKYLKRRYLFEKKMLILPFLKFQFLSNLFNNHLCKGLDFYYYFSFWQGQF